MQDSVLGPETPQIAQVLAAALQAVDPAAAVRAHLALEGESLRIGGERYDLREIKRILVIGGGKAGAPMAAAVTDILGERISAGAVNVKYGHSATVTRSEVRFGRPPHSADETTHEPDEAPLVADEAAPTAGGAAPAGRAIGRVRLTQAGHPLPDQNGQAGAGRMLHLLAGLSARDLVIVLLSGGGSALLPLPAPGLTLAGLATLTKLLLACGAGITEINALRKHCSQIQGGLLARLAAPARVVSLILSDVVGSPLDAIASGPTTPDRTTFADALAVLERYQIVDQVPPAILRRLQSGRDGEIPETPKPGDLLFARVANLVIGDNLLAGQAAVEAARRQGWSAHLLTTYLEGEARAAGRMVAGLAHGVAHGQSSFTRPVCLILGGETTVTLRGNGRGGRNQELALAAAIGLEEYGAGSDPTGAIVVTLATDGNDGPTDAAGGIVTPGTCARGRALGLDARASLDANDSYTYLAALESLVVTGPTNTNVNDLTFVFCS
jgi:glycerate 2-kinase